MANLTEYILLRKENDLLNSLIGQSFNEKSKLEAQKIINEIHYLNSKAQSRMIAKTVLCYIVDKNEIKGVGGSTLIKNKKGEIFSNLILDQFGLWLARLFTESIAGSRTVILKATSGVNETLAIYGGNEFNDLGFGNQGTLLQVGSGNTAPARTDFNIETAFGTAPESGAFLAGNPVYNSGLGNFKNAGLITAGGSGTINESVLFAQWQTSAINSRVFALFRDIISPAVSFIVGQSIALEYTVQL